MIRATRRGVLAGAVAMPAAAALPVRAFAAGAGSLLVHDPSLEAGRRVAAAHRWEVLAIEGDRIRFARSVFERRPALVVGVSRPADALLIEEVAREAGYATVSSGAESLRELIGASADRGLVLGWVLAPRR